MRILLTGFKPFAGDSINPSQELVQQSSFNDCELDKLILPVTFADSYKVLTDHLIDHASYDFILHIGLAAKRTQFSLERYAVNLIDCDIPDESGVSFSEQSILPEAPMALKTMVNIKKLQQILQPHWPVEISNSAGTYVCNFVYFQSLYAQLKTNSQTAVLFLHVPYLDQQVNSSVSNNAPLYSIDFMHQFLVQLLKNYLLISRES